MGCAARLEFSTAHFRTFCVDIRDSNLLFRRLKYKEYNLREIYTRKGQTFQLPCAHLTHSSQFSVSAHVVYIMRKKPLKYNVYYFKGERTYDIINSNSVRIRSDENGTHSILYKKSYHIGECLYSAKTIALCNEYIAQEMQYIPGLQTPDSSSYR